MNKLVCLLGLALLAVMGATTVAAEDLICDNTPATAFAGTADEVAVPHGAICFMDGADVDDVKVFGSLRARRTLVRGDVQAEPGHGSVLMGVFDGLGNRIYGSVQLKGGRGPQFSGIVGATIDGDVQAEENANPLVFGGNAIGGDLQLFKNTGIFLDEGSSANIGGNTVDGDLQCKENNPAPLPSPLFGANTVEGDKEDQCSAAFGF